MFQVLTASALHFSIQEGKIMNMICVGVLGSAGIGLISLFIAGTVLSFGLHMRLMLIMMFWLLLSSAYPESRAFQCLAQCP